MTGTQDCLYCRGRLEERTVQRVQEYKGRWFIIENLPALVCTQCGERFYTPEAHDLVVRLITKEPEPTRIESVAVYDVSQAA